MLYILMKVNWLSSLGFIDDEAFMDQLYETVIKPKLISSKDNLSVRNQLVTYVIELCQPSQHARLASMAQTGVLTLT